MAFDGKSFETQKVTSSHQGPYWPDQPAEERTSDSALEDIIKFQEQVEITCTQERGCWRAAQGPEKLTEQMNILTTD
jgi:hypothetical protein